MSVHWNHRVLQFVEFDGSPWLQIHEVHYQDGLPVMYTENAARVMGDSVEELRLTLMRMLACLDKPFLKEVDFSVGSAGEWVDVPEVRFDGTKPEGQR